MTERWAIFIVGACLTMGTAAFGQIVTMVWFAAKVKTTVDFLREAIEKHEEENEREFAHQSSVHREALEVVHGRVDRLSDKVGEHDKQLAVHDKQIAICIDRTNEMGETKGIRS